MGSVWLALASGWVLALSVLPLAVGLLPPSWRGVGLGGYVYDDGVVRVEFSDVCGGADRPKVSLYGPSGPVELVEVSGHRSYVGGHVLYRGASWVRTSAVGGVLSARYMLPDVSVVQEVVVEGEAVRVSYRASRPLPLEVSLWRRGFEGVEVERRVDGVVIAFRFDGGLGVVEVRGDVTSVEVRRGWRDSVALRAEGGLLELHITGSLWEGPQRRWTAGLVLPAVAAAVVAAAWLAPRRVRLAGPAGGGRAGGPLGPWRLRFWRESWRRLSSPWDVLQESLRLFVSGVNVYRYVYEESLRLQEATGLPTFYEGYAYVPHLLFVLLPFYAAYLAAGGDPAPIGGVGVCGAAPSLRLPDVYLFLLLIKAPLVAADAAVVWTLHGLSRRAAWAYAVSPYGIFITAVWGCSTGLWRFSSSWRSWRRRGAGTSSPGSCTASALSSPMPPWRLPPSLRHGGGAGGRIWAWPPRSCPPSTSSCRTPRPSSTS